MKQLGHTQGLRNGLNIWAHSKSVIREGCEFRLTYSTEYGFGFQARVIEEGEDWVDIEIMQDKDEVYQIFANLLGFVTDAGDETEVLLSEAPEDFT